MNVIGTPQSVPTQSLSYPRLQEPPALTLSLRGLFSKTCIVATWSYGRPCRRTVGMYDVVSHYAVMEEYNN